MTKTLDTIQPMNRVVQQIDMRNEELKSLFQTYAQERGMTVSGMMMSSTLAQHPELAQLAKPLLQPKVKVKLKAPVRAKVNLKALNKAVSDQGRNQA